MNELLKYFNYKQFGTYASSNIEKIIFALIILVFFKKIENLIYKIIKKINEKLFSEKAVFTFFNSLTKIIIKLVLIVVILQLLGINLNGIFTLIGALGLILGFAFKETISNVCGGVILLSFKPFKVGDLVEFKNYMGIVKKIEIFYTTILTAQNEYVIIPNGNLINNEIKNINTNKIRRLDLQIGVGYNSNIKQVKKIIKDIIISGEDLFELSEEPIIGLTNLGASSIDFDIKVYVKYGKYNEAKYYLYEKLKEVFDKENIEIPYNKLDVNINK